jgi:hypothetical protein
MSGSRMRAESRQLASNGKTRHLYLARTRHSHIAATVPMLLNYIMSNYIVVG